VSESIHHTAGAADKCSPGLSISISHNSEDFPRVQVIPAGNGLTLLVSNGFLTLNSATEAYLYLDWSVIRFLTIALLYKENV
jgi:hypothetical protein